MFQKRPNIPLLRRYLFSIYASKNVCAKDIGSRALITLIEITSNMIYTVALTGGFKFPCKIHLNTQWGGGEAEGALAQTVNPISTKGADNAHHSTTTDFQTLRRPCKGTPK